MDHILFHSVFELILVLSTFNIAVGHDAHNLLVVVQNREPREFRLIIEECCVGIGIVFELGIGPSESSWLLVQVVGH